MKVLYVISTLGGGGAESQLCSFAIELSRSHPKVDFEICALKDGGVFESTLEKNKIKYTVLHTKGILKSIFKYTGDDFVNDRSNRTFYMGCN